MVHFLSHELLMPLAAPSPNGPRWARVIRTEENGTDVQLATYMLVDGYEKDYEQAVIISNDTDLLPTIEIIRNRPDLKVSVLHS